MRRTGDRRVCDLAPGSAAARPSRVTTPTGRLPSTTGTSERRPATRSCATSSSGYPTLTVSRTDASITALTGTLASAACRGGAPRAEHRDTDQSSAPAASRVDGPTLVEFFDRSPCSTASAPHVPRGLRGLAAPHASIARRRHRQHASTCIARDHPSAIRRSCAVARTLAQAATAFGSLRAPSAVMPAPFPHQYSATISRTFASRARVEAPPRPSLARQALQRARGRRGVVVTRAPRALVPRDLSAHDL